MSKLKRRHLNIKRISLENNAQPGAILTTDAKLTDDQKTFAQKAWKQAFGGAKNFGKTALLENGLEYKPLAMTQKEMDFIESMKFTREDILIAFGVPKGVLLSEDSNNADGQNATKSFLENKIEPLIKMIVETINIQLVEPDFAIDLRIVYHNPVPADRKAMTDEIKELVDVVMTRNEARTMLGLETVEGGDVLFNSFTKQPLESSANPVTIDKSFFRGKELLLAHLSMQESIKDFVSLERKSKRKASKPKYSSVFIGEQRDMYKSMILKRMDNVETTFVKKINDFAKIREKLAIQNLENALTSKDVERDEIIDEKEQKEAWEVFLIPLMLNLGQELGQSATNLIADDVIYEISTKVVKEIEEKAKLTVESVTGTTNKAIDDALKAGIDAGDGINELSDRVSGVYEEFPTYRSDLIARTETTGLNARTSIDAYQKNGVEAKEWIATHDGNTRPEHMALDGEIVPVDKNFSDGSFAPPKHDDPYNCRCAPAPAIKE